MKDFYMGIAAFCISVLNVFLYAFVFCYLWEWFIMPFGIMTISIPHAIGLFIVGSFFSKLPKTRTPEESLKYGLTRLFIAFYLFGLGYVVSLFV